MTQNYIRYGGHSSYDPSIAAVYLSVSVLCFIPFVFSAQKLASLHLKSGLKYPLYATVVSIILIFTFYIISNITLTLLGYFDHWIDPKYASWYFSKEVFFHGILLGANFYFTRLASVPEPKVVSAHQGRKELTIQVASIEWIESDDHYLKIHLEEQSLIKRTTLDKMAEELKPDFLRIHRKYLINKEKVVGKEKSGRDEFVIMKTGAKVKVGRSYQPLDIF